MFQMTDLGDQLKGTISDRKFQTSLRFPKPQIFMFRVELHYNKLPVQQFSWKQHSFGKRDHSLLLGFSAGEN